MVTSTVHGRREASFELGRAIVSETQHAGALPRHGHVRPSLCLVVRGEVFERSDQAPARYGPGALIARPAGIEHEDRFADAGATCVNVELDPALVEGGHAPRSSPRAARLMRALRRELDGGGVRLVAEGLLLQLVGETFFRREAPRRASWLAAVDAMIDQRFTEPLTVQGLAAQIGVHPVTLSRTYLAERGRPVSDAVRERRLAYATELLRDPRATLGEIALRAGFADQSHFTRVFRAATGLTPAAARVALRR